MLGGSAPAHAGAIDKSDREASRLTFSNAVIREVGSPGLDAADSQREAYLTVRLAPESTTRLAGSPQSISTTGPASKHFRSSDFRLRIDRLDCSKVSTIGPLVVRQTPAALEIPDLVVTLPEDDDWYDWRDACLDPHGPRTGAERTGTLEYLAQSKDVLARIDFTGLGIHSLVAERTATRLTEGPRRMRVSMYCESLRYTVLYQPPVPKSAGKRSSGKGGLARSRVDVIAPLAERLEGPVGPS